jgi:antitoxin component YwqK of YwqJK toxin-antitoxin module/TPR repeat protein
VAVTVIQWIFLLTRLKNNNLMLKKFYQAVLILTAFTAKGSLNAQTTTDVLPTYVVRNGVEYYYYAQHTTTTTEKSNNSSTGIYSFSTDPMANYIANAEYKSRIAGRKVDVKKYTTPSEDYTDTYGKKHRRTKEECIAGQYYIDNNYQEAFKRYMSCEYLTATGENAVATMYENGQGTAQNFQEAVKWLEKALKQGDEASRASLVELFSFGYGTIQEQEEEIQCDLKRAEQGRGIPLKDLSQNIAASLVYLSTLISSGLGTTDEQAEAIRLTMDRANQEEWGYGYEHLAKLFASNRLDMTVTGPIISEYLKSSSIQKIMKPISYYKDAINQNKYGQYLLGVMYEKSSGPEKNMDTAIAWYRRSAEQEKDNKYDWEKSTLASDALIRVSRNGPGSYTSEGIKYEGNFKYGKLDGQGTESSSTTTVSGEWVNGVLNGQAKWHNATASYDGQWKNGLIDGKGTYIWNSNKYVGDLKAGFFDGQGTCLYSSGAKYEGGWQKNTWFGEGVYTTDKGIKQYASYADGIPKNCKYKGVYPNGKTKEEYVFVDTLKEGEAKFYYESGKLSMDVYYKHNLLDGSYKAYYENGKQQKELYFIKGKPNGNYKTYYEDGKIEEEGNCLNGNYDGKLKGYYKNGVLRVDCEYRDGKLWNILIYNKPDGNSTGCFFKDGEGEIKWYYEDGKLQCNNHYKNGIVDGEYKTYYENGKLWYDYIYNNGKLWNLIADNMPDGTPAGSNVKDGTGITMQRSADGNTITGKATWQNGVIVKQELVSLK